MRSLAQYTMQGRRQAIVATFLCGLIPIANLLTPALIGLICLRNGPQEAIRVLLWAGLPLLGWAMIGDISPLIVTLGALMMGTVLRSTGSWERTLIAAIFVGVAAEMLLRLRPEFLAQIMAQLEVMMAGELQDELTLQDMQGFLFSLFGVMHMFMAICLMLLARWWQAVLYNPGGFREEFHQLRLQPRLAMLLALLFVLASFGVPVLSGWVLYFIMPMFFAGLALVHGLIGLKKMSGIWLAAFYMILLNPLVAQLLTVTALIDSWYDFRSRIRPAPTDNED